MTNDEIAEILAKPYAQQLLNGPEPARLAYIGLDGDPRVVPIGFWTDGERLGMATVPKAAKVAALQGQPEGGTDHRPGRLPAQGPADPRCGRRRAGRGGSRRLPDRRPEGDDRRPVHGLGRRGSRSYEAMAVITITPTWVKLLDFETTIPKAVADLIEEKQSAG